MARLMKKYFEDRSGATAIEYGLIAAGIGLAIAVTAGLIGTDLNNTFVSFRAYL